MPALVITSINETMLIKFAEPERRNPLSTDVIADLSSAVTSAGFDDKVENVVFVGADDVFASGANLREIANLDSESSRDFAARGQALMARISKLPQRTFAAINGYCFGGGLDLALACDCRVASPNALFSHPGVGLGIITGWGGTQRLPRLIGEAASMEMLLTGDRFSSRWAARVGLVDRVASDPAEDILRSLRGPSGN